MKKLNLKGLKVLNKTLLLCFVLFFALNVFGEVHVKISPKNDFDTAFVGELKEFELIIANFGNEPVNGLIIEVSTDPELILIQEHEEKQFLRFELASISPGEKITQIVLVKPLTVSSKPAKVFVNYGIQKFTDLSATFLIVEENPVKIKATLLKSFVGLGEENALLLDILNSSSTSIRNVSINLIASPEILINSQPITIDSLKAGEGIKAKIIFTPKETVRGEKVVTLSFQFVDEKGLHLMEQNFSFQIQNKNIYFYIFMVFIFILIFLSYFFVKKRRKKRSTVKGTDKLFAGVSHTTVRTKIFPEK